MERLNLKGIFIRHKLLIALLLFPVIVWGAKRFEDVVADKVNVDNVQLDGSTVSTTNSNGDLILSPNGTGKVNIPGLTPDRVPVIDANGDLVSSTVSQLSLQLIEGQTVFITEGSTSTFTNKTIDADQNTITNIEDADIKSGAAIGRSKLASGSNSHVLINDGSGVMSSEATLAKSRGGSGQDNSSITFPSGGVLVTEASTSTLTNKTLTGPQINTQIDVLAQGELRLQDTTGGQYMALRAPGTVTSSTTLTLPDGAGSSGNVLSTNGSGTLSWIANVNTLTVESRTANFTAQVGYLHNVSTASGNVTATLPTAVGISGQSILFKVTNATNELTIDGNGAETIEGSTLFNGGGLDSMVGITSDGSNWRVTNNGIYDYVKADSAGTAITSTANTFVDITGASLSLPPGTWMLGYSLSIFLNWVSATPGHSCEVTITDGSNTKLPDSDGRGYFVQSSTADDIGFQITGSAEVTISSTTTYKLRMASNQNAAVATCIDDSSSSLGGGLIWARRMK